MAGRFAFIYQQPGTDPVDDRHVLERGGQQTILVPVPDVSVAPKVAVELADDGVDLIELCGGFSTAATAEVIKAVDGRIPVGHVTFSSDVVDGVAALRTRLGLA